MCHLVQKDKGEIYCAGIESVGGICPDGKIPFLRENNWEVWNLFIMIAPGLLNDMGGYNYSTIESVFNMKNIPKKRRPALLDKIMVLITCHKEENTK